MSPRIAILHKDYGIFLGVDLAERDWWSRKNTHRLPLAVTFSDVVVARTFFSTRWPSIPWDDFQVFQVDTGGNEHANILQLTRAGITDAVHYGDMLLLETPIGKC